MEIEIKDHKITPNQKIIEIREGNNLIATIIPRITMISIESKYIENVEKDMAFPPKIILNLKKDAYSKYHKDTIEYLSNMIKDGDSKLSEHDKNLLTEMNEMVFGAYSKDGESEEK